MPQPIVARIQNIHPAKLVLMSYLAVIAAGTALLTLPCATASGTIAWHDALFTATSAVCVTGLVVVDTGTYFTLFGQLVILTLIQFGGLGIMTFTVTVFLTMGRRVPLKQRMIMQETFAHTPRADIFQLTKAIFAFTFAVELLGALLLWLIWLEEFAFPTALYHALFHSVSAFCNAGFSLFPGSFVGYRGALPLNAVICSLIVLGGIGFPVVYEIQLRISGQGRRNKVSVQLRVVVLTTLILIMAGAALLLWSEWHYALKAYSFGDGLLIALFQSITCRTAGFNTIDISSLRNASLALMIFLMFVGASPGSCGGGVKTTTLALLGAFTWSRLRGRFRVNMYHKSIPAETVTKSVSLVLLAFGLICGVFFLLLLTHPVGSSLIVERTQFIEILFEVVSAFGTVGLSMGVTADLSVSGKLLIILMMLIGRVGVFTFAYVIAGTEARAGVQYAEQNLMIG
ncbi:TrkH family potassium uptake protein [Desulfoferrobacter suflitae]|uniref:TrkH family potassium uptake protein n=1 Tax=Desulfoferrobacter suflitae TaxID=2865782 RepID=UPI0021641132|nr:TrkH family potassium uptake protein [Desulfoferrobacter suflitae]MCK8601787.1 TrkH family potassium uptake protein [Desulfoferrobacter suflitae]